MSGFVGHGPALVLLGALSCVWTFDVAAAATTEEPRRGGEPQSAIVWHAKPNESPGTIFHKKMSQTSGSVPDSLKVRYLRRRGDVAEEDHVLVMHPKLGRQPLYTAALHKIPAKDAMSTASAVSALRAFAAPPAQKVVATSSGAGLTVGQLPSSSKDSTPSVPHVAVAVGDAVTSDAALEKDVQDVESGLGRDDMVAESGHAKRANLTAAVPSKATPCTDGPMCAHNADAHPRNVSVPIESPKGTRSLRDKRLRALYGRISQGGKAMKGPNAAPKQLGGYAVFHHGPHPPLLNKTKVRMIPVPKGYAEPVKRSQSKKWPRHRPENATNPEYTSWCSHGPCKSIRRDHGR